MSPFADVTTCGVNVAGIVGIPLVTSRVGAGSDVSVGSGVAVGASVGGTGVLVGIAACVSATIVDAAATDVCCISSMLIGGSVGCAPHALTKRLNINIPAQVRFFICGFSFY
jgi:hypothetical protein